MVVKNACLAQGLQTLVSLQRSRADSLKHELEIATQDSNRVQLMVRLTFEYKFNMPDSALYYGYKTISLAQKVNLPAAELDAMNYISVALITIGNNSKALQVAIQGLKIAEKNKLALNKSHCLSQ
jgi:hypothetical protein